MTFMDSKKAAQKAAIIPAAMDRQESIAEMEPMLIIEGSQFRPSNVPGTVRFFFRSPSASGPGDPPPGQPVNGLPPAGFYTAFRWSNPIFMPLPPFGSPSQTITAHMFNASEWSDWDGKPATDPLVAVAFTKATQNVQAIGLSFGGTCFFETGVTAVYPMGT